MKEYPDGLIDFIRENINGKSTKEMSDLVNENFDYDMTPGKMKSLKANYKLKSGTKRGIPAGSATKTFPKHIKDFIEANYIGSGPYKMAEILNQEFGTSYTKYQIKGFYGNHNLNSGLDGRFKKGQIPTNNYKKGEYSPGCEKGWFKKGDLPKNHKPVGSERVSDGYLLVKTSEPDVWTPKHKIIWTEANGPVPEGHNILFKDGDQNNIVLYNLALVSDYELLILNRKKLIDSNSDVTEVGLTIAKIFSAINKKKKKKGVKK